MNSFKLFLSLVVATTTVALVIPGRSRLSTALHQQSQHEKQQSARYLPVSLLMATGHKETPTTVHLKAARNAVVQIWKRMDTLEAAGLKDKSIEYPPLVSRGGGFKRFLIIMAVGMAYKWYRARFINKIPFWEKQPQWNMVVTTKEQEDALRAYTCRNCGATLFIARNREWFFEGGTGLAGLGCYSCGAKGKDNFIMDRERIVEEVGDDDDYFAYERPLDFVTAAERKALLKATKGDEEAANQILLDQQNNAAEPPPPMFGVLPEEISDEEVKAEDDDPVHEEPELPVPDEVFPSEDLE